MKKILLISSVLLAGMIGTASAQAKNEPAKPAVEVSNKAGWHKIATTAVELNVDKDAVAVFGMDKFKALHVKASGHGVHIKSMRVYYENGTTDMLDVNSNLNAGETSKDYNINSSMKIKKVAYVYQAEANKNKEKAHLELYGLK